MEKFSFTKADRLLKRSEFLRLSKIGKRLHNRHFLAVFHPSQENRTRLGITVTKKVGNAATRNKIKRRVRECFRLNRHNISRRWDINIIAKKEAANLAGDQVFLSLRNLFERIPR